MTENLRLTGEKLLTSADSDVQTSFVLPTPQTDTSTVWGEGVYPTTSDSVANVDVKRLYSGTGYGTLYNYYTATAGSGSYEMANGARADHSVCPRGWRLPISSWRDGKNIYLLLQKYGITAAGSATILSTQLAIQFPLSFALNGSYLQTARYSGVEGAYVVSNQDNTWMARGVQFRNYSATDQGGDSMQIRSKAEGRSVRCVNK